MTLTDVRHRAEYVLVQVVRAIAGWLPVSGARALGTAVGWTAYVVDRPHRRLAAQQLQAAFPVRPPRECRRIARQTFVHFGRLLIEVLQASTLPPAALLERTEFVGDDHIRAALARGKGVIMFVGHFGCWEMQGIVHPLRLPRMAVLARPLDNPYLDALLERIRCSTGNRIIHRQGAVRKVLRALAANEVVGIPIDQHIQDANAVIVEFFNRPAATTSALATLALRTGAPIVPAFALPLPGGRYRLIYEPPIEPPAAGADDPVRELTQRCSDVLEMYVRKYPHLWLWMHRRWRPEGEAPDARAEHGSSPVDESS
ncbi:MAG: lysophospholipid acyltransferase family protein [Acidobacteria bacterium]|nr:lysophospholipid acyltransferase family protein [Acidobacteriota bacterium]